MSYVFDLDITFTTEDVFSYVKASKHVIEELTEDCDELISSFLNVVKANSIVDRKSIVEVTPTHIQFENGVKLSGQNCDVLKQASHCLLIAITLGNKVDTWLASIEDDVQKVLADQIANAYLNKFINAWITQLHNGHENVYYSRRFEFGCELFHTIELRKIVDSFASIITYSKYGSFIPSKSVVFLIGESKEDLFCNQGMTCEFCGSTYCDKRLDERILVTVHSSQSVISYQTKADTNLFDLLSNKGYAIHGDCGKNGTCLKCKVMVASLYDGIHSDVLSCQYQVNESIDVFLDQQDYSNVLIKDNIIINQEDSMYGFVIDLGTTTLEVSLVGVTHGLVKDRELTFNPNRVHGADVISRIQYTIEHRYGLLNLHKELISELDLMCGRLIERNNIGSNQITSIHMVGNTVMEHVFTSSDISKLGFAPFKPSWFEMEPIRSKELGFSFDVNCYITPVASGFIGGDVIAGLLTIPKSSKPVLYIDLGTNGEMVLLHNNKIVACSAATGPAFEGGNIECGMLAITGAMFKVEKVEDKLTYHTITGEVQGMCGSGVISLIQHLLNDHIIFSNGLLNQIKLNPSDKLNRRFTITGNVYLSQADIRAIQLAKSAIRTGMEILLESQNVGHEEIDRVYLAGAFGNAVDLDACIRIGLFPRSSKSKITMVGNAASTGAIMLMKDTNIKERLNEIISSISVLDLSKNTRFFDSFLEHIDFPNE